MVKLTVFGAAVALTMASVNDGRGQQTAPAPRSDTREVHHDIEVQDPYRGLEAMRAPEVMRWARAQDAAARAYAAAWPHRAEIRDRIERAANHYLFLPPIRRNNRYFYTRMNSSATSVSVLMQQGLDGVARTIVDAGLEDENGLVIDRIVWPSPDGTLLAYGVGRAGSRWIDIRIREVHTGRELPDRLTGLRGGRFSNVSWAPDGKGLYYDAFAPPADHARLEARLTGSRVAFHPLGGVQKNDRILVGPYRDATILSHQLTDDGSWLVVTSSDGTATGNGVTAFEVGRGDLPGRELVKGSPSPFALAGSAGDEVWLYTTAGAPNGRVVGVNVARPDSSSWRDIVAEQRYAIDSWVGIRAVGDVLVGGYRERGLLRLRAFRPGDPVGREVRLPAIGSVWFGVTGRQGDPEFFFQLSGFADPGTVYRHDLASGRTAPFRAPALEYDPAQVVTRQVFYRNSAGTSVPMYLAYFKGREPDGRRPVMIYGYAFGGWSASPWFRPHMAEWFRLGGAFALPALRGGGEFGQDWAEAGLLRNRQNAVDDFTAAAEWLVANGLARPDGIIAETNSAGASVVGAAVLQRPNLFRAAIFGFPLLDLLRYAEFTGGARWRSQLGDVTDAGDFRAMRAYSPVHNVRPGVCYPAMLVAPGELDEVTPPFHGYKFVAALQRERRCDAPVLLRVSWGAGHADGRDQPATLDNLADQIAFVYRVLESDRHLGRGPAAPPSSP
jgi:prolyl oligopeptidase